jgi:3-phenylpropionate/trans-cinnamate dioxygenase ferredoxin reductase subunit
VVIGGGFIGLEVAASARRMGLEVTVLEAADRLMARVLPPMLSEWFRALHTRQGVEVITGARVEGIEGETAVRGVRVAGRELPADLVIVGIGVVANQELAEGCALACDDGILVDEACRTADMRIFAAGDCTRHPNPLYGRSLRLESVQNAVSQARVAAAGLLGEAARYDELPWFWSDQYDTKLQMAGLSEGHDRSVLRGDPGDRSFSVFYLREGRLIAADVINNAREFMACRKLLAALPRVDPARLADPAVALDSLQG